MTRERIAGLSDRLLRLQSAAVVDVLYELGYPDQALASDIRGLNRNMKLAGPAFCIKGCGISGSKAQLEQLGPDCMTEMFRSMYQGCVAVVETGGYAQCAIIGENVGISAKVRGCVGYVIDGGIRDTEGFLAMKGFPVFARFATPHGIRGRWMYTGFEEPLSMPGQTKRNVSVEPDDFILSDADGIAVIPQSIAETVIGAAEEVMRVEEKMFEELSSGVDREAVYRKYDRFAYLKQGKK